MSVSKRSSPKENNYGRRDVKREVLEKKKHTHKNIK